MGRGGGNILQNTGQVLFNAVKFIQKKEKGETTGAQGSLGRLGDLHVT